MADETMPMDRNEPANSTMTIGGPGRLYSNRGPAMGGGGVTLVIITFALAIIGLIFAMIGMGYNSTSY